MPLLGALQLCLEQPEPLLAVLIQDLSVVGVDLNVLHSQNAQAL